LPVGGQEWVFNGYCGVGPTKGCGTQAACPSVDGSFPGSPCEAALARCVKPAIADGGDAGQKIFVCSPR
jgi:hypothetical protein